MTPEETTLVQFYKTIYKERAFIVALADFREGSLTLTNVVRELAYDERRKQKVDDFKAKMASFT